MKKLPVLEFAKQLIDSRDLDPLYVILYRSQMEKEKLARWLVAYWCYYHAGLCCWIVDQKDYWRVMEKVAEGDYPRGTERRHFRGELAVNGVSHLRKCFGSAGKVLEYLCLETEAKGVKNKVESFYGFGLWIAWKVPDMIDRLGIQPITFYQTDLGWMFSASIKGAKLVATEELGGEQPTLIDTLISSHRYLIKYLSSRSAPPLFDRGIGVQETETIFCKWKSHMNGHYPVGKDSIEIRHSLLRYARSRTAQSLLRVMRQEGLWKV